MFERVVFSDSLSMVFDSIHWEEEQIISLYLSYIRSRKKSDELSVTPSYDLSSSYKISLVSFASILPTSSFSVYNNIESTKTIKLLFIKRTF